MSEDPRHENNETVEYFSTYNKLSSSLADSGFLDLDFLATVSAFCSGACGASSADLIKNWGTISLLAVIVSTAVNCECAEASETLRDFGLLREIFAFGAPAVDVSSDSLFLLVDLGSSPVPSKPKIAVL